MPQQQQQQVLDPDFVTIPIPIARNGINKDIEPTSLEGVYTPFMKNMLLEPSMIKKRLGYSTLGSNLPLAGTGMKLYQYVDAPGEVHLIALTTTHAYEYQASTDLWLQITPSTVLDQCESGWTGGTNVTNTDDTDAIQGTNSQKFVLDAQFTDGTQIGYKDITSVNISSHTHIGFWIKSSIALAASALEIVISESLHAAGEKTGTYVECLATALVADTWTFVSLAKTLTSFNAVVSVSIYANATIATATAIYLDDIRGYTEFTMADTARWVCAPATDLNMFTANGGTSLILTNQTDDLFEYEGDSGDVMSTLVHGYANFANADVIVEFWNHFMLLNFATSTQNSRSVAIADLGDIDEWVEGTSNLFYLTDSIGQIRDALKLGSDLIVYSDYSITLCRYRGEIVVFIFPTIVYGTGLFVPTSVWGTEVVHYFLGSNLKVYRYANGTHLVDVGRPIEQSLFAEADIASKAYMLAGYDTGRDRLYFLFPKAGDSYAKNAYVLNRRREPEAWEYYEFADTIRSMERFENPASAWYCDDAAWTNIYCDEMDMYCDAAYGEAGYPITVALSDDGYVFKLDQVFGTDNGDNIECEYQTQDLTIDKEEHFGRWVWFSAPMRSEIAGATVGVWYSIDGGTSWTEFDDSPVSIDYDWTTYRLPLDTVSRKIRYRMIQNSNDDLEIRDDMHTAVIPQQAKD